MLCCWTGSTRVGFIPGRVSKSYAKHEDGLEGRVALAAAYAAVLREAKTTLLIFEHSLEHLQADAVATIKDLNLFLRQGPAHHIRIILHDTRYCEQHCPRLLALQRKFSSQVAFRRTVGAARSVYDAFIVADDTHYVRRFHRDQWRGERGVDRPSQAKHLVYRFNELWDASEAALAPTVLGL